MKSEVVEALGEALVDGDVIAAARFDHVAEASEAFAGQWLGMENDDHASRLNTRKRDTPPSG